MTAHHIFAKIFSVIIALIFLYKIMAKIYSKNITENRLMNNKNLCLHPDLSGTLRSEICRKS